MSSHLVALAFLVEMLVVVSGMVWAAVTADRMDWLILGSQVLTFITALIGLVLAFRVKNELNGHMAQLLEVTKKLGHQEGIKEERDRPRDPPKQPEVT
jgi:hypothetical protein